MLIDGCGRRIRYLRLSVTAQCNLRCWYCWPDWRCDAAESARLLSDQDIVRLCRLLADEGLEKIRITGGEPLLHPGLLDLVESLAAIPGIREIGLTTNGMLLAEYAGDLAAAGIRRVNVSMDSLREERFATITRGGVLGKVFDGLAAAQEACLNPIKLNCVVMRGVNDDEVVDFALLTQQHPWHVRFVELMPIGPAAGSWDRLLVRSLEVREKIEVLAPLIPVGFPGGAARTEWQLAGAKGRIGFISPVSEPFCESCDRLRLMSNGELRACLRSDTSEDLGFLLASGASDAALLDAVSRALADKPACGMADPALPHKTVMAAIGG